MAQVVNSGGVMYRDALDHHPPGSVYLYAFVEKLVGVHTSSYLGISVVHAAGLLMAVLTAYGLYLIAREILWVELWILPAALYGIVTTTKCAYDGLAVNGELQMNLPLVFAIYFLIRAGKSQGLHRFSLDTLAGILVAIAGLSKWQALAAGLAFPFFHSVTDRAGFFSRTFRRGPAWILGLVMPIAATAFYFRTQGVLNEFLGWGGLFNFRYIAEGPGNGWALMRLGLQLLSVVLPSLVFYAAGFLGLWQIARRKNSITTHAFGIWVWTVVSILSIAIGGRYFGHYFLQAELPLCLLAAEPIYNWFQRSPRLISALMGVPLIFFLSLSLFPGATHKVFDPALPDWELVGTGLAQKTDARESLLVWGNIPPLYYFSSRKMGTRFVYCNYLTGLSPGTPSEYDPKIRPAFVSQAWPLLFSDLEERRPALILDTAPPGWKGYAKFPIAQFPEFHAYLDSHYREVGTIQGAVLYRRYR